MEFRLFWDSTYAFVIHKLRRSTKQIKDDIVSSGISVRHISLSSSLSISKFSLYYEKARMEMPERNQGYVR